MLRRLLTILTICATGMDFAGRAAHPPALDPQQLSICIPIDEEDSIGVYLINRVATFSVNPDSAFNADRILYGLPLVSAAQISLVTDEVTCSKAASVYASAMAGKGSGLSGRVLVAKVGTTGSAPYVVLDPYFALDSLHKAYVHAVMDSKFGVLHIFS